MRNSFYQSKEWIELRGWAIRKYGRKCQKCGSTDSIQVDHVLPRSLYPKLALNKHNLGVLCEPCNKRKQARIEKDYRPIRYKLYYSFVLSLPKCILATTVACLIYYLMLEG